VSRHLGLDLGGTNIKTAVLEVVDGGANVLDAASAPTGAEGGPNLVAARLIEAGRRAGEAHGPFESVGLGVPGLFEPATGRVVLFPNLPGEWPGYPLRDRVSDGLGKPVTLINDARAFTLAESNLGAGRGCRVIVAVVLGTGVGGGLTIDGKLHLGAFGTAGEIGHQTVVPDGPLCGCGNRGCLEALTKADALAELAGHATAEEAYEAAARGEERSLKAIDTVARYLGIVLANAVTLLGPDRVIIGGGIATAGDLLLGPVRAAVHERVTLVPTEQIEVVFAELGSSAGAIGAALAGLDQTAVLAR
jgi:glucokinase